jgi:16S rRNA (uracil1498-N3)-methyltransferase
VLRLRAGDSIAAFDGAGHEWHLRLIRVSSQQVQAEIIASQLADTTALAPVLLGQAWPKSTKMDLIVEKCSELGLTTLVPLYTERTVVREAPERLPARIARWQRIAEAAAQQCGRHTLLDIQTPQSLADFCQHSPTVATKILCWEGETQAGIRQVLESRRDAESYVVLIGPEGGWTRAEVELARTHGFVPVSLGPRVLRTETAAIAITSLIRYSRGDLEPHGERD